MSSFVGLLSEGNLRNQGFLRGLSRGLGFGLAYAVAESILAYVPPATRLHLQAPLHAILESLAFDLALGAALGVAFAPLLRLRRGPPAHTIAMAAALASLVLGLSAAFRTARLLSATMVLATIALYAAGGLLSARPRLAWIPIPSALLLLLAAFGGPVLMAERGPRLEPSQSAPPVGAPNLLLIVMDTVRADHLNLFGYGRETAPNLARLAAQGALFERAISAATWTLPSHASMFTGLYPSAHGAHHEGNHLAASNTTLAEILHARGFITVGFNANPWITESNDMAQGFERLEPSWLMMTAPMNFLAYRIGSRLGLVFEDHGAAEVTDRFTRWVGQEWDGKRPFFVFLNYIESHFPYQVMPKDARGAFLPPGIDEGTMRRASDRAVGAQLFGDPVSARDAAIVRDLYDAGILYEDGLIARDLDALRARGALDGTIVIVVSDHGELFGEHGLFGHEMSLSERLIHVPLLIRFPRRVPAGTRVKTPVTTVSLLPTALDLLGLPAPPNLQARSLGPLLRGEPEPRSPILSEQHKFRGLVPGSYKVHGPFDQLGVRYRAFEEDGWKLVEDERGNRWLFRPAGDPDEQTDLAKDHPGVVARLAAARETIVRGLGLGPIDAKTLGPGGNAKLDPAARERLKSLGYVQ